MTVRTRLSSCRLDRAQSSTVGFALVVALTVTSATLLVTLGGSALSDTEHRSELQRAEQTMALFDSQSARVAIGDSAVNTVELGASAGGYRVDPEAGSISITHLNYTGTGTNATLLPDTALGAVVYENDDTTIAYQGGGVWRTDRTGTEMLTPPEFHYRGATLTFPIVLTRGEGAVSGGGSAVVEAGRRAVPVYPNRSTAYPNGEDYGNPITNGTVVVEVESDYAAAWGQYFEERTAGKVTYLGRNTVRVELVGVDDLGTFEMPGEGGSVAVPGAEGGHSVTEFSITVRPDDTDAADFNNLQWSMYAEEAGRQFELHLTKGSNSGCGPDPLTADATVYYSDDGGATYHGWHREDAFTARCDDLDGDGDEEIYFDISFVDDGDGDGDADDAESTDVALAYQSLSNSDLAYFNPGGSTLASTTLDGHGAEWEPTGLSVGDELTIDRLLNHYFGQLPNEFALTVDDQSSDTVNEDASYGTLHTSGSGKFVTYLHATENRITVRLD